MDDQFTEALGVYAGPIGHDDAMTTLLDHKGVLVVRLSIGGSTLWQKSGDLHFHTTGWDHATVGEGHGDDDEHRSDVFIIGGTVERTLPVLAWGDVPLVLSFGRWVDTFDRYTGGLLVPTNLDTTLRIVLWHGILHETDTGDWAPALGDFATRIDTDAAGE